jgi:hypothetical protein
LVWNESKTAKEIEEQVAGNKHKECLFDVEQSDNELCCNGRPYYEGFMYGCMDAGNTQETCERFTD